jgi:hypothetical protein
MSQQLIVKLFEGCKGRAVPSVGICKILPSNPFRGVRNPSRRPCERIATPSGRSGHYAFACSFGNGSFRITSTYYKLRNVSFSFVCRPIRLFLPSNVEVALGLIFMWQNRFVFESTKSIGGSPLNLNTLSQCYHF